MLVGSVGGSWGTSRLWHDPTYEPVRDYRPVAVQRGLQEAELPKEEHLLPAQRPEDPYQTQESAYDVAAAQMKRGVEGQGFLHGRQASSTAFDAAVQAAREAGGMEARAAVVREQQLQRRLVHQVDPDQAVRPQAPQVAAPPGQAVRPAGATETAGEREAMRAVRDATDASELVDAAALAGGGLLSAAASVKALGAPIAATHAASAAVAATTGGVVGSGAAVSAAREERVDATDPDRRGKG